jgi:hypothetical protein
MTPRALNEPETSEVFLFAVWGCRFVQYSAGPGSHFIDDCQHFCRGDNERLLGEMLDVACYQELVFLA